MSASVNTFSGFDSSGQHGNKMPGNAEFNGHIAQPGNAEQEQAETGNPRSQPIPQSTPGQQFQGAATASLNLPTPVSQATPQQFSQAQQAVKNEVSSAPASAASTATNVSAGSVQSQSSGSRPGPQAHFTISGRPILLTAGPGSSNIIGTAAVVEVTTNQFKNRVAFSDASEQPHYDVSAAGSQVTIIPSQQVSANFSYNDSGMYSQPTTVPTYIEASPHHPPPQNTGMYQSYPNQTNSSLSTPSTTVGVNPQALGVAQQAYLQPQAVHQRVPISHTTRASPATVQWLLENYETAEGVSLPRSTLYNHYLRHCSDNKIDAVNAASFGKLIRSVFLGLKTRRLGTRGNSKYHYYGIRVKPNSPLARLTDDTQVAMRQQPNPQKSRFKIPSRYDEDPQSQQSNATSSSEQSSTQQQQLQHHQQYLGDTSEGLADLPAIEIISPLPEGITEDDVIAFTEMYRDHCEALLEVAISLQFPLVEVLWQTFWKSPAAPPNSDRNEESSVDSGSDRLPKSTLVGVSMYPAVQEFVRDSDYVLYQKLVEVLVPDVLRAVPSSLTQTIRNFAKSLENWLMNSMSEMPKEIVNIKLSAVSAFSQTLRRYTSLNHLAQAARAVLQNPQQINQMWSDLNKVDFSNVQEQASWVCQCDEASVQKLEQDFKQTLARQQTLEQWADWLERVVNNVLEPHRGLDSFPKAARQFLLKWSFYSSMIIRDLTLRSAASFGSFHLIRLLYDEYMFYLVEHKVAAATGKSPLAVMAEFVGLGHYNSSSDCSVEFGDPEKMSLLAGDTTYRNGANRSPDLKRESSSLLFEDAGVKRSRDS